MNHGHARRVFRCPVCRYTTIAYKRADRKTAFKHRKSLWCPFCKKKQQYKAECFGMKTIDIIGCSYEEMKRHLAKTFKANYGYDYVPGEPVHIDHIIPLSTAENLEDIIKLNHYTNLQLLKPTDNLTKQDRLDFPLSGC